MANPYLSVVLPVFNEEPVLAELYRRLKAVLVGLEKPCEIVFVDDGSRDGSFAALRRLHEADPTVRVVRFSRNFGHHIAITAGMKVARGERVVLMDCDLQDQPEEIPKLLAKLEEGFDVVYGVRGRKKFGPLKRLSSWAFVRVMNLIVREGGSINTNIFRVMTRRVVDVVNACSEHARFIVGLVSWAGFDQVGVGVEHAPRYAGETKYSLVKMLRLALSALTGFSIVPLQLASYAGALVCLGAVIGACVLLARAAGGAPVDVALAGVIGLFFLGGAQLVSIGILGEYVGRTYVEAQDRPLYVVARQLGFDEDDHRGE